MHFVGLGLQCRHRRGLCVVEWRGPFAGAQTIDVALSENGAHPGGQAAAAVKIAEQRTAGLTLAGDAVELRIERIGDLAGTAGLVERIRGAIQNGPALGDKVLPRPVVAERAGTRQGHVGEMQTIEVTLEVAPSRQGIRERTLNARLEGIFECVHRQGPARGTCLPVQSIEQRAL